MGKTRHIIIFSKIVKSLYSLAHFIAFTKLPLSAKIPILNRNIMPDKFTAVWVSHTSISDFLRCPRAYYLKNVYKDPKTKHKIKIMSPALALGQAVHEVLEGLSVLARDRRFTEPLTTKFEKVWEKFSGKKGGFLDMDSEYKYRERGMEMMRRVMNKPGPLTELSVKIKMDLPWYWLSEEENLILCGKVDWLQYLPETDSVKILDFKTGKSNESDDSLQLPIYSLLVHNCQKRRADSAAYWYLATDDVPVEKKLPDLGDAQKRVLEVARQMKLARQIVRFKCPNGEDGCPACRPFEDIVTGKGEYVGEDEYRGDVYILKRQETDLEDREGELL